MKVSRRGDWHELQNINVKIAFEGDFDDIHRRRQQQVSTDRHNEKHGLCACRADGRDRRDREFRAPAGSILPCRKRTGLARIDRYHRTRIHPYSDRAANHTRHSFTKNGGEKRTTSIRMTRDDTSVESGLEDLTVIKTTRSGFAGFKKDSLRHCPRSTDRIFCTSVKANWRYTSPEAATEELWSGVRQTILDTFAEHDSLSVQHTLHAMGEAVLNHHPDVTEISFSLPNIHCIPVDVTGVWRGEQERDLFAYRRAARSDRRQADTRARLICSLYDNIPFTRSHRA